MNTKWFGVVALLVGLLGISFEVIQIVFYESHLSQEWSYPGNRWNYLGFFTVIVNILVDIWFVLLAIAILFNKKGLFNFLTKPWLVGALTVYIATVGVIYCALLFWFIGPYSTSLWWANVIDMWNHLLLPVIIVVTWFFIPREKPMKWITLLYWMIFPLVYLALTMFRGFVWDWYPYPFLRPSWVLFPLGILTTTACLIIAGSLCIWYHNKKTQPK